jgi:hypothetical protein
MQQKKVIILIWVTGILLPTIAFTQKKISYYNDIEPIIAKHCRSCHKPNQTAPFSLLTFADARKRGDFIASVTKSRYMPPWRADAEFQEYAFEKRLSNQEIEVIQQWVDQGMVKGRKERQAGFAVHADQAPDVSISMRKPFKVPNNNTDQYLFFNLPTNIDQDTFLTAIEFIPGNPKVVHHSKLMTDTTQQTRLIDGLSAEDSAIRTFDKYPPLDRFFYGWVPGNEKFSFPAGTGKRIYKNTDLILNIHYSPNALPNVSDQSIINLYFAKKPVKREIFTFTVEENSISNQPFIVKANTKPIFYAQLGPIPYDISLIAALPHMHYLGKSFKAFAITPDGDAVNIVKIDDWNFRWQNTYQFKKMLRVPKNSIILIEAAYDNTSGNLDNPFNPPQDITYGWGSKNEMMNLIIYYLLYQEGDEQRPAY